MIQLNLTKEDIIYLDVNKTVYLKIKYIPYELQDYAIKNFDEMFNLHPEQEYNSKRFHCF